uniref:Protein kinase domain-containing protein n=1 Tax=Panagrolaimus sp. PS1159 TaxID=55785 RepID=A0AC35GBR2_9BILA
MNVSSMEDVPEYQQENLRIENGYAIIEMKAGDDLEEYNASLLLDRNESLRFIFNFNYTDEIYNFLNLTLNTSENESLTVQLIYGATRFFQQITFYNERYPIGTFDNSHFMSFELLPDGTLINNGSNAYPKIFPFSDAEVQEDDGKRHLDFSISWKNKVYGEFMIPLNQFAVEAPPTTTTSTTTTSTTTETTTTTATPKKLATEITKPPTQKESSVAKASISETSDAMIWGIGLSIYVVLYLI